jgi:hypothetical protein
MPIANRGDNIIESYYQDVTHLSKHKILDKVPQERVLSQMSTQLDRIVTMVRGLWWDERIAVTIGEPHS